MFVRNDAVDTTARLGTICVHVRCSKRLQVEFLTTGFKYGPVQCRTVLKSRGSLTLIDACFTCRLATFSPRTTKNPY